MNLGHHSRPSLATDHLASLQSPSDTPVTIPPAPPHVTVPYQSANIPDASSVSNRPETLNVNSIGSLELAGSRQPSISNFAPLTRIESEQNLTPPLTTGDSSSGSSHRQHTDGSSSSSQTSCYSTNKYSSPIHLGYAARHNFWVHPGEPGGWLSPLHIATQQGYEGVVRTLLSQSNTDPNERDSDGRTPLMHAIIEGHASVVCLLLAAGARVGDFDSEKHSALHYAAWYMNERILVALLETCPPGGPEVDACNWAGWTPLHVATARGFEAGVIKFLEAGANARSKAPKCPYEMRWHIIDEQDA